MSGVLTGCDVVVASGAIARCASLSCLHIISTHVGRIRCASIASGKINILRHSRRFFKCAYKALLPAAP
ncbi:hypothetical protein E3W25_20220 [Escherichia coli]|uniref:Uncharacterized protein n=1 Tax=Escherichia coli TaxID=562 RepID=A0A7B4Q983_ECOLX|nr:hypothetical protein [Escherichia coli]TFL23370.1 hypothetical protein ELY31_23260 [Escherichia coli]TXU08146.1 hypothetical protein D4N03_22760 [Escherichia coli]HAG8056805.1 hypothetical protein [Escherichia coli]HAJ5905726.1 hypothetical protein [Escherichia coli]